MKEKRQRKEIESFYQEEKSLRKDIEMKSSQVEAELKRKTDDLEVSEFSNQRLTSRVESLMQELQKNVAKSINVRKSQDLQEFLTKFFPLRTMIIWIIWRRKLLY